MIKTGFNLLVWNGGIPQECAHVDRGSRDRTVGGRDASSRSRRIISLRPAT